MQTHNTKNEFLRIVGDQIRWKRARKPLLYELESHIMDKCDALTEEGMEKSHAEAVAVAEMGDPETIGAELNRVHRPRPNLLLLFGSAALLILGIAMLWSVGGNSYQFRHMVIYSVIGIIFLILGYFFDYTLLSRFSIPVFCSVCSFCFIFGMMNNSFLSTAAHQLCYILPLAFAAFIYSLRNSRHIFLLSCCALLCVLLASSHIRFFGSVMIYNAVICCIILIYLAAKGLLIKNKLLAMLPALAVLLLFIILSFIYDGVLFMRLENAFNPAKDPTGYGWVPLQIRELIDSSAFIGAGAESSQAALFMGSADFSLVDYMLTAASYKHGLIVFAVVCLLTVFLIIVVILGVRRQSCKFGKLIILTIGLSFLMRIIAYIVGNLGFTLISLDGFPMFSCNGKLLILDMFVMGTALSVFRMESIARDTTGQYTPIKS